MSRGRQRRPIPVIVLTGFLGAGKTTLLNRLLSEPGLAGSAVIVNEFGEIGIDHLLVETAGDGLLELSGGCLCCASRGELAEALERLLRDLDNGRIAALERVLIETTGLADPVPVLQTLIGHPYLSLRYAVDGVVTVVDAEHGMVTLEAQEEAVRQVAVADRIVLSKTDRAGPVPALRTRLRQINPAAPVLDASAVPGSEALFGAGLFDPAAKSETVQRWLAEPLADAPDHDHGDAGHDHGDHHHHSGRHDAGIVSFAIISDRALSPAALADFLDLLGSGHGDKLLRVKGLVRLAPEPDRPAVVQGVRSTFHPPMLLDRWPDADRRTRLVFIVKGLAKGFVQRMFDAFAGAIRPDQPDAAALTDNPLAVPGMGTLPSRPAG